MPLFPVTEAELPALADFINAAYRGDSARQGWTHEADYLKGQRTSLADLHADLARPGSRLLAWRDEAGGEGLGRVWREPGRGDLWKLGMLTVRPDLQARQLGRTLLAAAEAY